MLKYCSKLGKSSGAVVALTGSLTGIITCFILVLFESLYYTNRDVLYWVTINNSVVPFVYPLIAIIFSTCIWCKIRK